MVLLSKPQDLTVDQVYDWYRLNVPNNPAIIYLTKDEFKTIITWEDLWKAIIKATEIIKHELPELGNGNPGDKPMVIAILANIDSPTYVAFMYAHFRLTHPSSGRSALPFLISTRNSALGVADLIKQTNVEAIWVSEGPMRNIAEEALKSIPEHTARILQIPSFDDLYHPIEAASISPQFDDRPVIPETPIVILHSSGSTSFPRPRTLRHLVAKEWSIDYERIDTSIEGEIIAVSPPPYHGMGLISTFWMAGSRTSIALNSPHGSFGPIASDDLLKIAMKTEAKWMITIPNFLEDWCENPAAIKYLQSMKGIIWGGGPFGGDAGKRLYDQGVPLFLMYGSTETGIIQKPLSMPIKEGYEWFVFGSHIAKYLAPTEKPDVFQVIVLENDVHHLNTYSTDIDGVPGYNTQDLIQRHPTHHELYRFVGRQDDQIILSTGQKTNPGPLETIIRKNPHVHDALYFGRGRVANGVLIQPASFEEAEKLGVAGFRNLIWASVEEANTYAPAHSKIFKEMILIATRSKPFAYTGKETLRKGFMLETYAREIEELYYQSVISVRKDIPIPLGTHSDGGWTNDESRGFVRQVVHAVMEGLSKRMTDDDDIFAFGCDSLLATYIRNTLLNALQQVAPPANVESLSANFVYHSPSINQLSQLLENTSRFKPTFEINGLESENDRKQRLETIIYRYTQDWTIPNPEREMGDEEVILLTGTTGALGTQMLVYLINMPSVVRIYAVNHPSGRAIYQRHVDAFNDRGHDLKILESRKIVFVEGDTSIRGFGVDSGLYEEMRLSVTTIIHNAWRINFIIPLTSYEPAIRGVRQLIDFALSSPFTTPPKVLFTSSIGNIKAWANLPPIPEEPFLDINQLTPMGYTESKWISERILSIAGDETSLKPVIVRVGQLVGGAAGDWNVTEWFPNLVAASQRIKGLPSCDGLASYVTLQTAASAMLELRHAPIRFAHLVHPQPVPLNDLIQAISDDLGLPIIPYNDWLKYLEDFCKSNELTMAAHLLDFYKTSAQREDYKPICENFEAMGWAVFQTTKTVEVVPSLRNPPVLNRKDVQQWLSYWKHKHILS